MSFKNFRQPGVFIDEMLMRTPLPQNSRSEGRVVGFVKGVNINQEAHRPGQTFELDVVGEADEANFDIIRQFAQERRPVEIILAGSKEDTKVLHQRIKELEEQLANKSDLFAEMRAKINSFELK